MTEISDSGGRSSAATGAVTNRQTVIERVRSLVGKGDISSVDDRDNYDLRYWMDATKAGEELGWRPAHDLDDTLQSTVDWYLSNPEWLEAAYKAASPGQ